MQEKIPEIEIKMNDMTNKGPDLLMSGEFSK